MFMSEGNMAQALVAHESEIKKEKQTAWDAGSDTLRDLVGQGAEQFFKKEFPDLAHAFSEKTTCACCVDEGMTHKDMEEGDKFALAGSGILYRAANEAERLDKVSDLMIARGVTVVTSHGGCGAAGLAYKRDFPGVTPLPAVVDKYAVDWAVKLVEAIERKQHAAEHVHVAIEEMSRPEEFHNARAVYFDAVGGFNPSKEIGLPMGFVIEKKFISAECAADELGVGADIALGQHGFGELFSAQNPLVVVVFAPNIEQLVNLKKEVAEILKDDKNFQAGKVKIDGLVVEKK